MRPNESTNFFLPAYLISKVCGFIWIESAKSLSFYMDTFKIVWVEQRPIDVKKLLYRLLLKHISFIINPNVLRVVWVVVKWFYSSNSVFRHFLKSFSRLFNMRLRKEKFQVSKMTQCSIILQKYLTLKLTTDDVITENTTDNTNNCNKGDHHNLACRDSYPIIFFLASFTIHAQIHESIYLFFQYD